MKVKLSKTEFKIIHLSFGVPLGISMKIIKDVIPTPKLLKNLIYL